MATYREGGFGYAIPLADGLYTVTRTFVEPRGDAIVSAIEITR